MSFIGKKWVVRNKDTALNVFEKLLCNRDLDSEDKRRAFFEHGLQHLHDPMGFKDMGKAVNRIREAIEKKEKIVVFGDYDVDGITATVILYDFLKKTGADVKYVIPNRENDGYGLKDYFIRQFKEDGVNLIITVDCGSANKNEIALANELGLTVIITDHHDIPSELPDAYAILNPKQADCSYLNKDVSGSVVSYKLVTVLAPHFLDTEEANSYLYKQLGLATLGLVADCMSLTGENRFITKYGLKSLSEGYNPGLTALMENIGIDTKKITSTTIGFYIGPRINAAGRLDTADHASELLLGDTEKVILLNKLNAERQKLVERFLNEAKAQVEKMDSIPSLIVVHNSGWNVGTLGLIAGKVSEFYNRPTIAMQERDEEYVASCRSLNDFDITSFLRSEAEELFIAFGGHKLAGGFTLPKANYDELIKRISNKTPQLINPDEFQGVLEIDGEITPHEMTFDTCYNINRLEPFGHGNPEPTLMIRNAKIHSVKTVGNQGNHLQFPVICGEKKFKAIAFRFGQHIDKIDPNVNYDIAFNMEINEWKGYKNLQLKVVDIKPAG